MRIRSLSLLPALALVIVACGGSGAAPEPALLSYALESGQTLSYEFEFSQSVQASIEGDLSALAEASEEPIPGEIDITLDGTLSLTYDISDGPDDGTFEVHVTGELVDIAFEGTVDGEPLTDIPELDEADPIDLTIIVDEQGRVIVPEAQLDELPFGPLDPDMLGSLFGQSQGLFLGPPLPDEPVTVGDSWSDSIDVPGIDPDQVISTQVESSITGTEDVDGNETLVIETTTLTTPFEIDLVELLFGVLLSMVDEFPLEGAAQIAPMIEQLELVFALQDAATDSTAWFDSEAQLVRKMDMSSDTTLSFDAVLPDESTGDLVEAGVTATLSGTIGYTLIDSSSA